MDSSTKLTASGQSLEDLLQSVRKLSDLHARGLLFTEGEAGSLSKAEHLARLRAKKEEIKALLAAVQSQQQSSGSKTPDPLAEDGARTPDPFGDAGEAFEEEESLYENTGPSSRFAKILNPDPPPPPLPPRAPRGGFVAPPPLPSGGIATGPVKCSTPKDGESQSERLRRLHLERDHLKQLLIEDDSVRDKYYLELETLSKRIRSLSIANISNYSLDNEAERQKLEQQTEALRIQNSQGLQRRQNWVQSLNRVDSEIQELELLSANGGHRVIHHRRTSEMSSEMAGNHNGARAGPFQPRSVNLEQLYHEALPSMNKALSHSGPAHLGGLLQDDAGSVMSFSSSIHSVQDAAMSSNHSRRREDIDNKIECVNSLVSLLGCTDIDKMSRTFEAMSSTAANCELMRSHRVIPLLVQLLHGTQVTQERPSREVRFRVAKALYNIVQAQTSHPNEKQSRKKEAKILKLLENLRLYADFLRDLAAAIESQQFSNCEELARRGCQFVCIKTKKQNDASDLIICDISQGPEGSKSSRSSLNEQALLQQQQLQQQALHSGSSSSLVGSSLHSENGVDKAPRVLATASFPCKNFINYSQEAMLLEDNCLALPINIEETMAVLTRCSFDESHRQPISLLGGIPALAELIQVEKIIHGDLLERTPCSEVRRYAVVALTNLTFGNAAIKSFLCSSPGFVPVMVQQLGSPFENLRKATAHLFRNLAWKADKASKAILSDSNVISVLMRAAMDVAQRFGEDPKEEATLKVVLSALWNLSAHCGKNKADICAIDGSLPFLVHLLQSDCVAVVENGGGILRNISSYIATCNGGEKYRAILREHNCLYILLQQLKSPSLTIVSNACGTLWNFSARNREDQHALWQMDAVPMLKSLTHSKHKTIATCSAAALKNLTAAKPVVAASSEKGSNASSSNGSGLEARRRRNLMVELDDKLTETCDNIEGNSSDDSGSDDDKAPQESGKSRPESRGSLSSTPSVTSNYADMSSGSGGRAARPPPPVPEEDGSSSPPMLVQRHPLELSKSRKQMFMKQASPEVNGYPSFPQSDPGSSQGFFRSSSSTEFHSNPPTFQQSSFSVSSSSLQYTEANSTGSPMVNNFMSTKASTSTNGERIMSASKIHLFQNSFHEQNGNDLEDDDMDERPRDYSLRFQDAEDPDLNQGRARASLPTKENRSDDIEEDTEDTVKTFCTEGTPYDTPCLISTATSMSDLRDPDLDTKMFHKRPSKATLSSDQYQPVSGTFSGMDTPSEKPQVFDTEGTPGFFSRADSLSSLGSEDVQDNPRETDSHPERDEMPEIASPGDNGSVEKGQIEANGGCTKEGSTRSLTPPLPDGASCTSHPQRPTTTSSSQNKQVTFNQQDTPMMFSRCSSFESLNSFDQHSIRDGYSSCDFSRATSGRVSPSDLPDSPGDQSPARPQSPISKRPLTAAADPRPHGTTTESTTNTAPPMGTRESQKGTKSSLPSEERTGTTAVPGVDRAAREEDLKSTFDHEQPKVSSTLPELPNSEAFGTSGPQQTLEPVDEKSNGSKDTDEEEIYAETLLSNITKLGMPNDTSRPESRRSRSGIPVVPSKSRGHYPRSSASSCYEAPRQFATEDTPIALSQAGSQTNLSTLTCEDDLVLNKSLDTSGEKTDDSDLDIENIILAGMNSKAASRSILPLGERGSGEGAPSVKSPIGAKGSSKALASTSSKFGFQKKTRGGAKTSTSNGTVSKTSLSSTNHPDPRFMLDTPSSGRSRHPSNHRNRLQSGPGTAASSNLTSGRETPVHFATEDTPHVFSRCDSSLSSLSAEDPTHANDDLLSDKNDHGDTENTGDRGDLTASSKRSTPSSAGVFRSHLPRPQALGRSESSGSSTKSSRTGRVSADPNRSTNSATKSSESDDDDEELMACVINIGMPKSKSEPLDLKTGNANAVVKREKKSGSATSKNRRSTSKSPRNSKVIPGVRIAELKLKPRSTSQEKESLTLPLQSNCESSSITLKTPVNDDNLGVSQIWTDESPNCAQGPRTVPHFSNEERTDAMIDTLTVDNALKLSDSNNINTSEEAVLQMEAERVSQQVQDEASMVSSVCSTLSTIQPPSLMLESLMSISGERGEAQPNDTHKNTTNLAQKSPQKKMEKGMECRHTLSAKKGFAVPEMVRRALGVGGNPAKDGSNEDLSSLSSCQSNLDNIKPPTLMEDGGDMDNSMMSLASLNSEVVDMGSSNETNAGSTDNEKIFDLASTGRQIMNSSAFEASEAPELMGIEPPTIMDDVSGVMSTCSKTLVPEPAHEAEDGATYVIESGDAGQSTCQDITDVFDDDTTIERSDPLDEDEAPELPRDSRHTTPAQSGGESSLENTPKIKRKLVSGANLNVDYYLQYRVPVPDLDDSSDMAGQDTSGYKSETNNVPSSAKSSVQRRKEESDRFRTHTISKSDLIGTDSSSSSSTPQKKSPKSIKQKREEDGDRFKTHVITPADLRQPDIPVMSPMEVKLIAEDAQLVVDAIKSTKANARSRSSSVDMLRASSIEILDEKDMKLSNDFSGSEPSLHIDVQQPMPKGPRVCKPWESRAAPNEREEREDEPEVRGIRGRRKPLYTTPPKRSTIPPAIPPKPALAPKPKTVLSAPVQRQGSPPTQIRGTRASNLRQVNTRGRMNSPPSPKLSSPRNRGSISSISSISSKTSTVSTRSNRSQQKPPPAPLIRQGTFTKDDSSSSPNQSGEETRIPPRVAPKPMIRRDLVHPVASQRPPISTATRSAVKMPVTERGRSNSSQMSAPDLRSRNPRLMQTKASQLRERSSSRSSRISTSPREQTNVTQLQRYPSTSSASSFASGRSSVRSSSGMKTSSSSHALKTGNEANRLTKRVPSSSSIDQQKPSDSSNVSDIQSETGTPGTGPKKPKREVTSRIASLWKKVEDSKKKNKECAKDPRVWIAQGKVIPEHELELLKPHAEQKQIISNFQAQRQDQSSSSLAKTEQSNQVEVKPRSRSRLSMRLSKFAKPKKDKDSKTPTSPMSPCSTQDSVNGNSQTVSPSSPIIDVDDILGNGEGLEEIDATNDNDLLQKTDEESRQSKRRSRLGTFLNPEGDPNTSNASSTVIQFRNPNNRSPQSAAIVPPFNYNPPTMMMGPPPPPPPRGEPHYFVRPKPVPASAAQVRRNDSYVSSMGRKGEEEAKVRNDAKGQSSRPEEDPKMEKSTSSVMVTLV